MAGTFGVRRGHDESAAAAAAVVGSHTHAVCPVECYLVLSAGRDGQVKVWLSWRHVQRWYTGTAAIYAVHIIIYIQICIGIPMAYRIFGYAFSYCIPATVSAP